MSVELAEIRDFVAPLPPFSLLDAATLDALPKQLAVRYLRRGSDFPPADEAPALYLVRKGAIERRDAHGSLVDMLAEGDVFAAPCLGGDGSDRCTAVEDTLVYLLPCPALQALRRAQPAFDAHFAQSTAERLRHARRGTAFGADETAADPLAQPVGAFAARTPVAAPPTLSIREAAQRMSEARVSALMIVDGERLAGIVTDRDLRRRCLAAGLSPEAPVTAIMSAPVASIGPESPAFEALLAMTRLGIHHLPLVDAGGVRGLVSSTDLLRRQGTATVHLARRVRRCASPAALTAAAGELPELQLRLAAAGAGAAQVGQALTAIYDAVSCRLIELAEGELGPPPVPYAWAACGSQGRHEQTVHSDQDNALVVHDDYRPEAHGAWFAALAQRVNDGLDACGVRYCPGRVMASNAEWRQPQRAWCDYFAAWIGQADQRAAMLAANFLDLRVIRGDPALLAPVHATVVRECAQHELFLARMTANALANRPPLGFFRNFLLEHGGAHVDAFDIKRGGLLPISDLARVHALAAGRAEIGTLARLHAVAGGPTLSAEGAQELAEAFEFLGGLRLRHQSAQLRRGETPDNLIAPAALSALERAELKAAFAAIGRQQAVLAQRYAVGREV
ncbi:MAG: cyclic nucleotide-binding/CBS domain-containing protein [Rhodocyclales bacterium]|nr:cyclic nucleotide-binding/CBS domain-containing protein [Rhodocyclales bacterium]